MNEKHFLFGKKKIHYCEYCDLFTYDKQILITHLNKKKHNKTFEMIKEKYLDKNKDLEFSCDTCYHTCSNIEDRFIHKYLTCKNRRKKNLKVINKIFSKIKKRKDLEKIYNTHGECGTDILLYIEKMPESIQIKSDTNQINIFNWTLPKIKKNYTITGIETIYKQLIMTYLKDKKKNKKAKKSEKRNKNNNFCACKKSFSTISNLNKHQKSCKFIKKVFFMRLNYENNIHELENKINEISNTKNKLIDFYRKESEKAENERDILEDKIIKLTTQLEEKDNKFIDYIKNTNEKLSNTNEKLTMAAMSMVKNNKTINNITNNNKVSINVYLNDTCKDAMSLQNFMDKLDVTLEDVKYSLKNGLVKGFNNIFNNIKKLETIERPIHCTDIKRLNFYVKNNDKWEKDINGKKIDRAINFMAKKQLFQVAQWEKENPDHLSNPDKYAEWQTMLKNINGDGADKNKNYKKIKQYLSNITNISDNDLKFKL